MRWDPDEYARYATERSRPFVDLMARVGATAPRRVVDLGCGDGSTTRLLAERWPDAVVEGLDSSTAMIAAARADGVTLRVADAREWRPPADCDVVISNAMLQWLPGHGALLRDWAAALPAGGWLAFQVPGNFAAPSHALMRSVAASPRWAPLVGSVLRHEDAVLEPAEYAALMLDCGVDCEVWETTYLHMLPGTDPVLEWVRGTGLRPVLSALSGAGVGDPGSTAGPGLAHEFEVEYAAALRAAYPATEHGTPFPFRRIFAVAHKRT